MIQLKTVVRYINDKSFNRGRGSIYRREIHSVNLIISFIFFFCFTCKSTKKILMIISAPPLAFEVPVHENGESIIKKHPPKRFRRLEEQQQDPSELSHQLIDERQSEAEARRREILDQRIRSAKQRIPLNRKFLRSDAFNQDVSS